MEIQLEYCNVLIVPEKITVHEDKKTKARTIALPFGLPDGSNAVVMLCRLHDGEWNPSKHIKSVIVQFNEN